MKEERPLRIIDVLTRDEIAQLNRRSNWWGVYAVASTWGIIGASLAAAAVWPATWLAALFVIAGRQTALMILVHEAMHEALFATRRLNYSIGQWFCLHPLFVHHRELQTNREHHLRHHVYTMTQDDPDLGMFALYPKPRREMFVRFAKDLCGLTAVLRIGERILLDAGLVSLQHGRYGANDLSGVTLWQLVRRIIDVIYGAAITNGVLFGILWLAGHPEVYLVWLLAWATLFQVYGRLRLIIEHAGLQLSTDPLRNSRTIASPLWERVTYAPFYINYHLEHHLIMTVPCHRLPALHSILRERGLLANASVSRNCIEVLRIITNPALPRLHVDATRTPVAPTTQLAPPERGARNTWVAPMISRALDRVTMRFSR